MCCTGFLWCPENGKLNRKAPETTIPWSSTIFRANHRWNHHRAGFQPPEGASSRCERPNFSSRAPSNEPQSRSSLPEPLEARNSGGARSLNEKGRFRGKIMGGTCEWKSVGKVRTMDSRMSMEISLNPALQWMDVFAHLIGTAAEKGQ